MSEEFLYECFEYSPFLGFFEKKLIVETEEKADEWTIEKPFHNRFWHRESKEKYFNRHKSLQQALNLLLQPKEQIPSLYYQGLVKQKQEFQNTISYLLSIKENYLSLDSNRLTNFRFVIELIETFFNLKKLEEEIKSYKEKNKE